MPRLGISLRLQTAVMQVARLARDFWDNLKDYQKKNVLNAVGYYNINYRELKLDRYVK